jgi:hypothetical protein
MKTLSISLLPELTELSAERAAVLLDDMGTRFSIESVNWPERFSYKPITFVSTGRSKTDLYLLFKVHGNCLRAANTQDNQNVNEDSCVEFFVQVPDTKNYINFEFNCAGVCKAAYHVETRDNFTYFAPEQMARIERWSSIGKRAFNELSGLFAWELSVRIPFELIGLDTERLPSTLYGNFYKCADATAHPHYVTWNPVKTEKPDFHRPEFFGEIHLV